MVAPGSALSCCASVADSAAEVRERAAANAGKKAVVFIVEVQFLAAKDAKSAKGRGKGGVHGGGGWVWWSFSRKERKELR